MIKKNKSCFQRDIRIYRNYQKFFETSENYQRNLIITVLGFLKKNFKETMAISVKTWINNFFLDGFLKIKKGWIIFLALKNPRQYQSWQEKNNKKRKKFFWSAIFFWCSIVYFFFNPLWRGQGHFQGHF